MSVEVGNLLGLIFTYVMAYGGSVAALLNPYVGFLIYVAFAILAPGVGCWAWSVPVGNYSKVLAVSVLAGWAIHGAGEWQFGRARLIAGALVAYLIWNVVSATEALVPEVAWEWVEAQGKIVLMVVIGLTLIDSLDKLKQLAWVVLLCHGYVAYEANVDYFSGFNRLKENGFGSMDNNSTAITLVTCTGLGIFLCLGAPRLWQKGVAAACVAFMVHAILFSFSRGGMLGLIVVIGLSFILIPKRPVHVVALIGGIALTLAFTGPEVALRFTSTFVAEEERDGSAQSRVDMWWICVRVAGEHPVTGLGPHHFHVQAHEFGLNRGKEAHTTWLQLAAEIGIPGATLLSTFFLATLVRLGGMTRTSVPVPDPFYRDIARMVIASTVGYMVTAQFVTVPGIEAPYYIVLLGAGALKVLSNLDTYATPGSEPKTPEASL